MADDFGNDSAPAPSDTGAPVAQPTTPTAAPAQPAIQGSTPAPATSGVPEGYVPSYRVRETREAAIREANNYYAQREAAYQQQLQQVQQQLYALVGAQPPGNPEVDAVRNQFGQLYPGLSRIESRAQEIMGILDRAGDLESQNNHYWQSYGRQSMDKLFTHAQEALGAPLTDEGKRQLHAAFVGFVQSSPEMTARYANDPTLVQEFWKQFTSSFIDPVRRTASATTLGRVPGALPQDTPGGVPRSSPAPQMQNLDERAAAAWALYNQSKT